jgi:hypothetical protein
MLWLLLVALLLALLFGGLAVFVAKAFVVAVLVVIGLAFVGGGMLATRSNTPG